MAAIHATQQGLGFGSSSSAIDDDGEAMTRSAEALQDCRQDWVATGDGEAIVEYRRFTIAEANAGQVEGWTLAGRWWYPTQSTWWAWFRRTEMDDGEAKTVP